MDLTALVRKVYHPIGFKRGYNFALWVILGGAMLGFTLARFMYLDYSGVFCAPGGALPSECFWYQTSRVRKVGIVLHLATILPAAFLAVFQFVPAIRYRALLLHRINGWIIALLSVVSCAGVAMIMRHSFGGTLDMQVGLGLAIIIFLSCLALAVYNIKRLQIEQHRAWMLRAWIISGFIITMRLFGILISNISSTYSRLYTVESCAILDFIVRNQTSVETHYPSCAGFYSGADPNVHVVVEADMGGRGEQTIASVNAGLRAGAWLALAIHIIAVETYLRLTPREAERLRKVSYQKQLEAGMKRPGDAGLTVQRLGDAESWVAPEKEHGAETQVAMPLMEQISVTPK